MREEREKICHTISCRKTLQYFSFFIRMFVTRCDHTMHFFCLFFLVVVCVCTRSRWHIGYTKKEHVHKTNKNRELGFWFKPLKFKHFLQHIQGVWWFLSLFCHFWANFWVIRNPFAIEGNFQLRRLSLRHHHASPIFFHLLDIIPTSCVAKICKQKSSADC